MAQASFPEPKSLSKLEIGDGVEQTIGKYSLENPHPKYGKDPNILNEYGHTEYPKWVDSKINGERLLVNNPMEESQHLGFSNFNKDGHSKEEIDNKSPWE